MGRDDGRRYSRSRSPENRRRRRSSTPPHHRNHNNNNSRSRDDVDDRRRRETSADRSRHAAVISPPMTSSRGQRMYRPPSRGHHHHHHHVGTSTSAVDAISSVWELPVYAPKLPAVVLSAPSFLTNGGNSVLSPPPPPSPKVTVEGLSLQVVSSGHIRSLFHQCGVEVVSVERHPLAHQRSDKVVVEFQSVDAALEAANVMNGGWVNGTQVRVTNIAQTASLLEPAIKVAPVLASPVLPLHAEVEANVPTEFVVDVVVDPVVESAQE